MLPSPDFAQGRASPPSPRFFSRRNTQQRNNDCRLTCEYIWWNGENILIAQYTKKVCAIVHTAILGCRKEMCTRQSPKVLWDMINALFWHCSCRTYFCCFPLALANIRPWPLVPFSQISLKNSELHTTHNTFRDCRVHFLRQPFLK